MLSAVVSAALLVAAGGVLVPESAAADPQYPSIGRLQQAGRAASAKAAELAAIQTALAAGAARLDAARVAAEQAAEKYDAAQIELARRSTTASVAGANAAQAAAVYQQSRAAVGRLAAQAYQDGGAPSLAGVVFASNGLQDLLDRSTMLDVVGSARVRTMQQMNNSRIFATWVQQQADEALRQQQHATATLDDAQRQAQQTATDATAALASAQAQQRTLLAQLTSLQATSVLLAQQRQAGLAAEASAREANARRARNRAKSSDGPGWTGNGSGTDPGAGPDAPSGPADGTASGGLAAVAWAKQQLGLPYQWGGAGPNSYDCSGLTMRAWERAGVSLPHYAASQYVRGAHVAYGSMRPGDLIFYATDTGAVSSIHHVTMYVGAGMMIEAPYTGANVRIVPIRWNQAMPWAGRP